MLLINVPLRQTDTADKTESDNIVELNDVAYNHYRFEQIPSGNDVPVPVSVLTVPESDVDQDIQDALAANDEDGTHEETVFRFEGLAILTNNRKVEVGDDEDYLDDLEELNGSNVGGNDYPALTVFAQKVEVLTDEFDHGMTTFAASSCVFRSQRAQKRDGTQMDFRGNLLRFDGFDFGDQRPVDGNYKYQPYFPCQVHGKDLKAAMYVDDLSKPRVRIHGSSVGVLGFYTGTGKQNSGQTVLRLVVTEFYKSYEIVDTPGVGKKTNQTINHKAAEAALSDTKKAAAAKRKERAAKAAAEIAESTSEVEDIEDTDYV